MCGLDLHDSKYGQVADSCKHDHEHQGVEYGTTGLLGCVKWLKSEFYYLTRLLDTELFIIVTCKHCLGSQECMQIYS